MKFFIYCSFVFVAICKINAQFNYEKPSFRVGKNDLSTEIYERDSLADAVVLYEKGRSFITQDDYSVVTEIEKKIKIINTAGFQHATVKVYLYNSGNRFERIRKIKATTYNIENNKVTKVELDNDAIFKEKLDENHSAVTFTLPNVKEGSVLTYSYIFQSPFIFNFYEWEFQEEIPKIYSLYETKIPANYEYHIKLVGFQEFDIHENDVDRDCFTYGTASADCTEATYVMKNIPAFVEEKHMTTKENYASKLEYELNVIKYFDGRIDKISKEWKDADSELKMNYSLGKELRKKSSVKNVLPKKILAEQDALKRAQKIYNFVRENYKWNGSYQMMNKVSVSRIVKEKSGNIGSLNSLLHNVLKYNGFDAMPLLLATREVGFPTKLFPVLSEFNYLVVKVTIDGKDYLLDASDDYLVFGQLPYRCLNSYGRLLDFEKGSSWYDITYQKNSMNYVNIALKFESDSLLKGKINTGFTGYSSYAKRKAYYPNPQAYKAKLSGMYQGFEIVDYKLLSLEEYDDKFKEEIQVAFPITELMNASKLYLDPYFVKFFTENPFRLNARTYPVDFGYKRSYFYQVKIDLDNRYSLNALPKSYKLALPERKGTLTVRNTMNGNSVSILFKLDLNSATYHPAFYDGLKQLMKKAVESQLNTVINLTKNE